MNVHFCRTLLCKVQRIETHWAGFMAQNLATQHLLLLFNLHRDVESVYACETNSLIQCGALLLFCFCHWLSLNYFCLRSNIRSFAWLPVMVACHANEVQLVSGPDEFRWSGFSGSETRRGQRRAHQRLEPKVFVMALGLIPGCHVMSDLLTIREKSLLLALLDPQCQVCSRLDCYRQINIISNLT